MQKNTIINKAKKDNGAILSIGIGLTGICIIIFALHWNFLFNSFSGPFNLEKSILDSKSIKKYLKADVPLMPVGSQKTGIRMFGNVVGGVETAKYMITKIEDKFLLVKVSNEYKSGPVKGGIANIPNEFKEQISGINDFYPVMLDCQVNYILDTDLFMILSVITFPFAILVLFIGISRSGNPASHKAISQFKNQGKPLMIVEQIEIELSKLPHNQEDSLVFYSDKWIVLLEPSLKILKANDLIGYGIEKDKNGIESIALWIRGEIITDTLILDRKKLTTVINRLKEALPNRCIEDTKRYKKQWNTKRKELEKEFDNQKEMKIGV